MPLVPPRPPPSKPWAKTTIGGKKASVDPKTSLIKKKEGKKV